MLIEFSVANYRSFRDEVTFSMVASSLKEQNAELNEKNLFAISDRINLVTSAAIYGANASGKSNLISAIDFMRDFVMNSHEGTGRTGGIDIEPFRLSARTVDQPSFFEVVFVVDEQRFRYGFEVTTEQVEAEWLYVVPTSREAKLFERKGEEIYLGDRFKAEGRDLHGRTRPNALFLSVVAQFDGKTAQKVLGWFRTLGITTGLRDMDIRMRSFTKHLLNDEESAKSAENIVALIKQLDLGIEDIRMEREVVPPPDVSPPPDDASEEIIKLYTAMDTFNSALNEVRDRERTIVRTVHRKFGEADQPETQEVFDLDEHESEGTKKIFSLSGPLVDTLDRGDVLIIDELDARLHPMLTREIVRLFNEPETNPNHAQLVFATQDTNLLDKELLRRDQIWFVEKDRQGASHLYSLAEFKVRNDATYEKDYIQGRYGAIPFLGNIREVLLGQSGGQE